MTPGSYMKEGSCTLYYVGSRRDVDVPADKTTKACEGEARSGREKSIDRKRSRNDNGIVPIEFDVRVLRQGDMAVGCED